MDAVTVTDDEAGEDSWWVSGMRRDVEVEVQCLFKQRGMYFVVFECDRDI